jgi:hypothetical protein
MSLIIKITDKELDASGVNIDSIGVPSTPAENPKDDEIKILFGPRFIKVKLNVRKTLDNNVVVSDHPLMDIVIIPAKNKIFTIPKDTGTYDSYPAQDRFFKFLDKKGIIIKGTVRSGVILNSLESFYPPNKDVDVLQVILLLSKRFIDKENDFLDVARKYDEDVEDMFVDPEDEDTTEFGEIPQATKKGSISIYQTAYGMLYRV